MAGPPPTSVILPTRRWTPACAALAAQLGPDDELLVVCDAATDPVAERVAAAGDRVRLVVAGPPTGCSGKANAIAAGMTAATTDRFVWTDDDFHHPDTWLSDLHAAYATHGPVSEAPFFVGRDPLAVLLEPIYAIGGSLGTYTGNKAWGGAVMFDRTDLDVEAFLAELRHTVSDDGLLSEHLAVTTLRRTRAVPIGGRLRTTVERHVRFTQIVHRHGPRDAALMFAVTAAMVAATVLAPVYAVPLLTLLGVGVYALFGRRRWTALLTVPAVFVQLPLMGYALWRDTFVWGGRRYRWPEKFTVEIVAEPA